LPLRMFYSFPTFALHDAGQFNTLIQQTDFRLRSTIGNYRSAVGPLACIEWFCESTTAVKSKIRKKEPPHLLTK